MTRYLFCQFVKPQAIVFCRVFFKFIGSSRRLTDILEEDPFPLLKTSINNNIKLPSFKRSLRKCCSQEISFAVLNVMNLM